MIETSPLVPAENGRENSVATTSKSRVIAIGNEENQENMINLNETSFSTPTKKDSVLLETPSTVSARREWLNDFAKRNSNHHNTRNNKISSESLRKPHVEAKVHEVQRSSTVVTNSIRPVVPVTGVMKAVEQVPRAIKRNFTPRKNMIAHSGIEATDDGYASVATLSQWLASDPTVSKKKKTGVRRGRNVSYKSRKFDRGQEDVVVRENHIQRGSVTDKKNWLKNAFQNMDAEPVDELTSRLNTQYAKSEIGVYDPSVKTYAKSEVITSRPSTMSVAAKKDWLKKAFKSAAEDADSDIEQQEEARSVVITDDAASRLSVSDKKSWLQSAFKKSEEMPTRPAASRMHSSAATDIVHSRGNNRDEIAARAKRRFLQRSTRTGSAVRSPVKRTPTKRRVDSEQDSNVETDTVHHAVSSEQLEDSLPQPIENRSSVVELVTKPTRQVEAEEDTTPVDFRAARDFLVQRTQENCETTD